MHAEQLIVARALAAHLGCSPREAHEAYEVLSEVERAEVLAANLLHRDEATITVIRMVACAKARAAGLRYWDVVERAKADALKQARRMGLDLYPFTLHGAPPFAPVPHSPIQPAPPIDG